MSSPSDMHISPPASPPRAAASSEKKEALLFELRFNQVRLLQRALSSLVLTATGPDDDGSPALGDFHILTDDVVFLVAKTVTSPKVDTCLALKEFTTSPVVPAGLVLCLNLRLLEDAMAKTVGDREGLSLCLKGEKEGEIVYSLTQENGNEESSVIPVISTTHVAADPVESFWSGLENSVVPSFQVTVLTLHHVMVALKWGSPVQMTATETSVLFKLGAYNSAIRGKAEYTKYKILRPSQDYPLLMEFHSFHPKDAILNAVALAAENVVFHLSDSRCVLEFSVNGVGSILFCFDAKRLLRGQGSQVPSSPASTLPA